MFVIAFFSHFDQYTYCIGPLSLQLLMFFHLRREKILEYRDESQRLDQCGRLYDSSVSSVGFELDASHIIQVWTLKSSIPLLGLATYSLMIDYQILLLVYVPWNFGR